MKKQKGFTLIEIAIVLVIIGLLLGGVLKGQELITSARVRNLISQQDGIKAAYFGFLDRFRALPGDYNGAVANIAGATTNGNNNGQIRTIAAGDAVDEQIAAWEHLSRAGFINGSYTYLGGAETTASAPTNPYARFLQLIYDSVYAGTATNRHNLKTGNQVPSDILAEVDRKIDDGVADGGTFRFSAYPGQTTGGGTAPTGGAVGTCYVAANGPWNAAAPVTNCGASSLF
ncbi:MAG: prepilin-type N-terminal cleavage/methylation domain-containing protein [Sulfuricaulis sp.]|uniref:prepilin-type N-terminal cleavage/methylation domain-containing protein n=1 Tax=Sulfuricaulis sp. TaxID=2003553 RepID=UPI0034A27AFE